MSLRTTAGLMIVALVSAAALVNCGSSSDVAATPSEPKPGPAPIDPKPPTPSPKPGPTDTGDPPPQAPPQATP